MRKTCIWIALMALVAILPLRGAEWVTHSSDYQRTGWQKNETAISKESVKNLKLLWKITLDTKRDLHGVPFIGISRQNLDKTAQEGLSEHEQVEQDEECLEQMCSYGACATQDRRRHTNRVG